MKKFLLGVFYPYLSAVSSKLYLGTTFNFSVDVKSGERVNNIKNSDIGAVFSGSSYIVKIDIKHTALV